VGNLFDISCSQKKVGFVLYISMVWMMIAALVSGEGID
jgi:hypothetical protein